MLKPMCFQKTKGKTRLQFELDMSKALFFSRKMEPRSHARSSEAVVPLLVNLSFQYTYG